jgi:hypothetical protein
MKSDEIRNLFSQFEAASSDLEGVECWSARELQELLGYSKWENFERVIQKAKDACNNAGEEVDYHFPDIRKTIPMPKGQSKDLQGQTKIEKEHVDNNLAVRNMLTQRGIVPENLPPAEDVKKLQRKLDGDEKKLLKSHRKKN